MPASVAEAHDAARVCGLRLHNGIACLGGHAFVEAITRLLTGQHPCRCRQECKALKKEKTEKGKLHGQ
eukprot:1161865-Pelagomonas_calceolata.AAC.14